MTSPASPRDLPANRRLARDEGPSEPARRVVRAPRDPEPEHDSPLPAPTTHTVRPPRKPDASPTLATVSPRVKRWLRTLQLVAGAIVVIAASIAVAWGARRYLLTSPRFSVRRIDVSGNARRSAEDVARAGGLQLGANVFALDLEAARGRILQDPWIESATVTRKLPSTIQISVVEREPRALVVIGGEPYLATRDGDLFKKLGDREPADLPVVSGIDPERVARDRPGVVLAVRRALDVVDDLDRAGITKGMPVQELALQADGSLVVFVGREGLALALGRPPYRDKIDRIKSVLWELARRKANASVVFADNDTNPERVVVRMR